MTENEFYTSLINLSNLIVDSVAFDGNKVIISCHISTKEDRCVTCQKRTTSINQYTNRVLQDLSIVGKEVSLQIRVPQFHCEDCNRYFTHELSFADANKSYTHRQSKWIFELCHQQPFTEVGALVNLSNVTVQHIYFERAAQLVKVKERFNNVRKVGIDEIAHRKGKGDFCCVLTDLERGIELDILSNRKKETIIAYFKELGTAICEQIQVVACDIWDTYIAVAKECFPNVTITIDRFHVIKALNESLDAVRKSLRKDYKNVEEYKKLKWILFKQPHNCSEEQHILLNNAFKQSPTLHQFYIQRNRFNEIYNQAKDSKQMANLLITWTEQAEKLEHPVLNKFIKTVRNRMEYIASYANTHVTNAVTEGLNNLIRHVKRISFGMPNFEHLRLRVLLRSC
jgi:transposase